MGHTIPPTRPLVRVEPEPGRYVLQSHRGHPVAEISHTRTTRWLPAPWAWRLLDGWTVAPGNTTPHAHRRTDGVGVTRADVIEHLQAAWLAGSIVPGVKPAPVTTTR